MPLVSRRAMSRNIRAFKKTKGYRSYNARIIQRKWRARRSAKRYVAPARLVGMKKGTTNSKCVTILNDTSPQARNTRLLYFTNLTAIQQGTGIQNRLRQHADVNGFRIMGEVGSSFDSTLGPVYFNEAVLAPRQNSVVTSLDFFRGMSSTRAQTFDNSLTSNEMSSLPINSDDYAILYHKRRILGRADNAVSGFSYATRSSYIKINKYVPFKRQVRWTTGNTPTDGAVFHVFWCDAWGAPSGEVPKDAIRTQMRYVTYFREPRT